MPHYLTSHLQRILDTVPTLLRSVPNVKTSPHNVFLSLLSFFLCRHIFAAPKSRHLDLCSAFFFSLLTGNNYGVFATTIAMDNPNPNLAQQSNPLPPINTLIKPEQIPKLQHFPENQKEKYIDGIKKLWETIESSSAGSESYQTAYKKLFDVTLNIKAKINKTRQDAMASQAANGGQQNGARPAASSQQGPLPDSRLPAQHMQGVIQTQSQGQFSEKVIQKVRELDIQAPPQVTTDGPERASRWVKDTQNKYAQQLKTLEEAMNKLGEIKQIFAKQTSDRTLSEQELRGLQAQQAQVEQIQKTSRDQITKFVNSQRVLKERQVQGKPGNPDNTALDQSRAVNAQPIKQEPNQGAGGLPQVSQEPQGQPHTVSSALDAARNQPNPGAPSAMSPQNHGVQQSRPPINQLPISRPQPHQMPNPIAHPHLNINTNSRPPEQQHNSPHVAPPHSSAMSANTQEPVALSHHDALEQARSYSHPNISQSTPQSGPHGHPSHDQRNQRDPSTTHTKMPIPKDLNLQPTQPVPMGPSRPTLTNGPVAMGPMGQPAIQRHPGYVLEGEGERVLSKKKLEELVRQVTGGTGGEGEESEGLTADVEEVRLNLTHYIPAHANAKVDPSPSG